MMLRKAAKRLGGHFATETAIQGPMSRFWKEEDGAMSYLAIYGSLIMMIMGGMGIDYMYNELQRTKVQATLDRAVLGAADLQNSLDPQGVVEDYFLKMGIPEALIGVDISQGINYKTVSADAMTEMNANFLRLLGIEKWQASGTAAAEERINKVEISMVLDISGSMANDEKLVRLKSAANTFVDTVLKDGEEELVSINLVPYSEHVNAGPLITNELNVNWRHGYSHCLEFPESEFTSVALNSTITYEQAQHYQWNYFGDNELTDTVCPRYDYERILPMSKDPDVIKGQIAQFQPRAGTSIFMGLKWGAAMLDPSFRSINDTLVTGNHVDEIFSGRPFNHGADDVIKTVVLMTDGQHDRSFRIQNWAYDTSEEVELWADNNLWYYLDNYVSWDYWWQYYTQKYNAELGDSLLKGVCDSAKDSGIIIWSVGFEVQDHGASVMQDCASSPAHFFRVEGTEIEDAFYSIARTINQLRLTQ